MDSFYCREGLYTYELWCIIFDVVKLLIQCIIINKSFTRSLRIRELSIREQFRLDLDRWASSLHTQAMEFYARKQTKKAGLLGQRKEVWTRGSYYFTVTREAARRVVASHTRQEIRKCFLGTILILQVSRGCHQVPDAWCRV